MVGQSECVSEYDWVVYVQQVGLGVRCRSVDVDVDLDFSFVGHVRCIYFTGSAIARWDRLVWGLGHSFLGNFVLGNFVRG